MLVIAGLKGKPVPVMSPEHQQGAGGGRGLGLYRQRARLVDEGGHGPLCWPARHRQALAGGSGHGGEPALPPGARGHDGSLMNNNGGQPTATTFRRACATWEIPRAFTRDNNPRATRTQNKGLLRDLMTHMRPSFFPSPRELFADIGYS
jgi:hypothetical protein